MWKYSRRYEQQNAINREDCTIDTKMSLCEDIPAIMSSKNPSMKKISPLTQKWACTNVCKQNFAIMSSKNISGENCTIDTEMSLCECILAIASRKELSVENIAPLTQRWTCVNLYESILAMVSSKEPL